MDADTKTLLLVIVAVAGGSVLGWYIKQNLRQRRTGSMAAKTGGSTPDDGPAFIPVATAGSGGGCGCRS